MTRPSLAGIERDRARAAQTGKCVDDAVLASYVPALTAAVRDVLALTASMEEAALHAHDTWAPLLYENRTNDALRLRATLAAHLDLTDPEGDPT